MKSDKKGMNAFHQIKASLEEENYILRRMIHTAKLEQTVLEEALKACMGNNKN